MVEPDAKSSPTGEVVAVGAARVGPDTASAPLATVESGVVTSIGDRVQPTDVDGYLRVRDADERLDRLRALIKAWEEQQAEERGLRRTYAKALITILGIEIAATFVAFFLTGAGVLTSSRWMAEVFLVGALAQSTSLVLVVVKYLFPDRSSDVLKLVETITLDRTPTKPQQ